MRIPKKLKTVTLASLLLMIGFGLFSLFTFIFAVKPIPASLTDINSQAIHANILDRHGYLLALTRLNKLNHNITPIWQIPEQVSKAFVEAEDSRFFEHHGVDWYSRVGAIRDNIRAGRIIRGASTITEQCIRIIHPRPRTFFTRFTETIEAYLLESRFSKDEILEFYLNQVPFSHQCRGVSQASDYYFNRTLDTLSIGEILILAVAVRAPSQLNPLNKKNENEGLRLRVHRLANVMNAKGIISYNIDEETAPIDLEPASPRSGASHFVQHIKKRFETECQAQSRVMTTLDINLQTKLHQLLKQSIIHLENKSIKHSAILVLDHQTDEIMAWVNSTDYFSSENGSMIDAVEILRQPGSALKPFLYAQAMESGFTAASIIPDTFLIHPVGHGLHTFKNYSSHHYGPVRLRCALGNSLNIPAIRMIRQIGTTPFLDTLHKLGFESLTNDSVHYGEGLALGNGEVSLFELVRAYSILARSGIYREPRFLIPDTRPVFEKQIFSKETCSIISHILSDPAARMMEFGNSGLLDFPVQTAVKTGTSTDYRDAWAVGYNYKYTAGVWMGNLDYTPTREVTGSRGPALVLRSVFHELNRNQKTQPLYISPVLQTKKICSLSGRLPSSYCPATTIEWFKNDNIPDKTCNWHKSHQHTIVTVLPLEYNDWVKISGNTAFKIVKKDTTIVHGLPDSNKGPAPKINMVQPVPGLHIALDPRIPDDLERFPFIIQTDSSIKKTDWFLNGKLLAATGPGQTRYPWKPERGRHVVYAAVTLNKDNRNIQTQPVTFLVK